MSDKLGSYRPVSPSSTEPQDDDFLLTDLESECCSKRKSGWTKRILVVLNVLVLIALNITLISYWKTPSLNDENCTRHMSTWSPLIEANAVKYYWTMFSADIRAPSPYRGPPTPERELAWKNLWRKGGIDVPTTMLASLNKTAEIDKLRTEPQFGGGYAAMLEYQHQLHCVNTLRQWTYRKEYDTYPDGLPESLQGSPGLLRIHLDHCVEVLRIFVMCQADLTPVLLDVNPKAPQGYSADLNTKHKCRNVDAIGDWVVSHKAVD